MGCVVNGPGESRLADIGISLPGAGEHPSAPVYMDGERVSTLKGSHIAPEFCELLEAYVASRFGNDPHSKAKLLALLDPLIAKSLRE